MVLLKFTVAENKKCASYYFTSAKKCELIKRRYSLGLYLCATIFNQYSWTGFQLQEAHLYSPHPMGGMMYE